MKKTGIAILLLVLSTLMLTACQPDDVEKGNISLSLGDYPRAMAFFEAALQERPDHAEARLGMGKALLQKAMDGNDDPRIWDQAMLHLEAFRTLAPDHGAQSLLSQAYTEKARFLLDRSDTLSALKSLARSRDIDPEDVAAINLAGILYCRLGQPDKGETLFFSALALDTANASANFNLGMLSWQRQDYEGARDFWSKALKNAPQDEDILFWFALSEKHLQDIP